MSFRLPTLKEAALVGAGLFALRELTFPLREKSVAKEVVLITGAAGGIGRLVALRLAAQGAVLVLWDINEDGLKEVVKEIEALGGTAKAYRVDVSKRETIYAAADDVLRDFDRVDILINNAGIVTGKKLLEDDDRRMELMMSINANALLWTTKKFLPGMLERDHGHVVNVASCAGRVGVNGLVAYCGSKFAAVGIDEALRGELRARGSAVRTTCVQPMYIASGMFEGAQMNSSVPALNPLMRQVFPVLEPDYVADKIVTAIKRNQTSLVMPRAAYTTHLAKAILPTDVFDHAMGVLGVSRSMSKFVQNRPAQ